MGSHVRRTQMFATSAPATTTPAPASNVKIGSRAFTSV